MGALPMCTMDSMEVLTAIVIYQRVNDKLVIIILVKIIYCKYESRNVSV